MAFINDVAALRIFFVDAFADCSGIVISYSISRVHVYGRVLSYSVMRSMSFWNWWPDDNFVIAAVVTRIRHIGQMSFFELSRFFAVDFFHDI